MKGHAHIVFGPIGAGKTTFSLDLARKHKAIKFSTDEWFKALFFDDMEGMPAIEWTFERISRCKAQIWNIAQQSLNAGNDVIFDLGLQKVHDRARIKQQCESLNIMFTFYCLSADKTVRQQRVVERNQGTGETFSFPVSTEMFAITDAMFEPATEAELAYVRRIGCD